MKRIVLILLAVTVLLPMVAGATDFKGFHGYAISQTGIAYARTYAGWLIGTVDGSVTENGCSFQGSFSDILYPEALEKVLSRMDLNGDSVITKEEVKTFSQAICAIVQRQASK